MDTLKVIKEQIKEIRELSPNVSLDKVLTHIDRAEFFYKEGKNSGDDNYFTDVIYRTNQAFEGSLRESYTILADKTDTQTSSKRTIDIEEFFESQSIFNERVLHFFRNYRKEWRNKSTHDFKLFFNESEAFLAIVNVSAYIYVLFNQIIEKLAFQNEQNRLMLEKSKQKTIQKIVSNSSLELHDQVVELIKEFSIDNDQITSDLKEIELIGMFNAFVKTASKNFEVKTDLYHVNNKSKVQIDMMISSGKERVLIEVKKPTLRDRSAHESQLLDYLIRLKTKNGILWYPSNVEDSDKLEISEMLYLMDKGYRVYTII